MESITLTTIGIDIGVELVTLTALAVGKLIAAKLGAAHLGATVWSALGGVALAGGVIAIAYLTIREIANWFQEHRSLAEKEGNIGITIKTKLDSGEYAVVQGIYNRNTDKLAAGRTIKCSTLDPELQEAHKKDELVIYPVS